VLSSCSNKMLRQKKSPVKTGLFIIFSKVNGFTFPFLKPEVNNNNTFEITTLLLQETDPQFRST